MSRAVSATSSATSSTNPKEQLWRAAYASSNAALFVRNLRLLDYDKQPDWPDITARVFSSKDVQTSQKARIKCTEWALFHLFGQWDPEETREKLQPFFPPLEPLQSLNLRAALFRCLNELKKNGILGRDIVIRKSMFDECKGEKIVEILAVFSTIVLKKALSDRRRSFKHPSAASRLATTTSLDQNQQTNLLSLVIAHQASLQSVLQHKTKVVDRCNGLGEFLNANFDTLEQRSTHCVAQFGQLEATQDPTIDLDWVKTRVRENWLGNKDWLSILVSGEEGNSGNSFWKASFDQIWEYGEQDSVLEAHAPSQGLLENLESRVQKQQIRLKRWKAFHEKSKAHSHPSQLAKSNSNDGRPMEPFTFDAHEKLKVGSKSKNGRTTDYRNRAITKYDALIAQMQDQLAEASRERRICLPHTKVGSLNQDSIDGASEHVFDSQYSIISPVKSSEAPKPTIEGRAEPRLELLSKDERHRTLDTAPSTTSDKRVEAIQKARNERKTRHALDETTFPSLKPNAAKKLEPAARQSAFESQQHVLSTQVTPQATPLEEASPIHVDPRETLAEQIISSVGEATPSPAKKPRPSLMERTRMSMAPVTSLPSPTPEEDSESDDDSYFPTNHTEQPDRRASLLERTRQSMSHMSMQQQSRAQARDRKPAASRKSRSRQSYFPVNQFETPRKQTSIFEEAEDEGSDGTRTPKDTLYSTEADYASVFKSRPKIAMSPVISPVADPEHAERETEMSPFEDMSGLDEPVSPEEIWASSPSRRAGPMFV